jgi:nitrite reductase/ring-hydroxylating ferredoxin subunit
MNNNQYNQGPDSCACPKGNSPASVSGRRNRRGFFHACFALLTGIAACIVAFPVFSFFRLPKRINTARKITVPVADLSKDQALFFDRQGTQIVLIDTAGQPKVFDAACTHLGCLVTWDQNEHVFHCPCHGAVFDDKGQVVKGPTNVPLKKIDFEIKNNVIVIS